MAFREVRVYEIREVLRLWLDGEWVPLDRAVVAGGPQDGPPLRDRCGGARSGPIKLASDSRFAGPRWVQSNRVCCSPGESGGSP